MGVGQLGYFSVNFFLLCIIKGESPRVLGFVSNFNPLIRHIGYRIFWYATEIYLKFKNIIIFFETKNMLGQFIYKPYLFIKWVI